MKNIIKNFNEFVNEGIISDYKKQKIEEEKEISAGDKKFILELLRGLQDVEMPFVMVCRNCAITGEHVKVDAVKELRKNTYDMGDIADVDINEIHITEKSYLKLLDEDDDFMAKVDSWKNIWDKISDWFDKKYDKMDLGFSGIAKVSVLLELKNDIKKDLL